MMKPLASGSANVVARRFNKFHFHSPDLEELPKMLLGSGIVNVTWRKSIDPRPGVPSHRQLERARTPKPIAGIKIGIMSGKLNAAQLIKAFKSTCEHSLVSCSLFGEFNERPSDATLPASMPHVPRDGYQNESVPVRQAGDCCPKKTREEIKVDDFRFYCDGHRALTLSHQYRYLPALAYLQAKHESKWMDGSYSWLVLIDDDATVRIQKLVDVLARYNHDVPVYMGDFGQWTMMAKNIKMEMRRVMAWEPPYACGGSATVFSKVAMRRTDFHGCVYRYHRGCYQSDWMIGRCSAAARNIPMVSEPSCGTCLPCALSHIRERQQLLDDWRPRLNVSGAAAPCAFATFTCQPNAQALMRLEFCQFARDHVAVSHGYEEYCEGKANADIAPFLADRTKAQAMINGYNKEDTSGCKCDSWADYSRCRPYKNDMSRCWNACCSLAKFQMSPEKLLIVQAQEKAKSMGAATRQLDVGRSAILVTEVLKKLSLLRFRKRLFDIGLFVTGDLRFLTSQDCADIGMTKEETKQLLGSPDFKEVLKIPFKLDPKCEWHIPPDCVRTQPITNVMIQMDMNKLQDRLKAKLGVRSLEDMTRVTDKQLESIKFRILYRRKYLEGGRQIKRWLNGEPI